MASKNDIIVSNEDSNDSEAKNALKRLLVIKRESKDPEVLKVADDVLRLLCQASVDLLKWELPKRF